MNNHYDVIIVGGRIAGSSLAMRLAQQNLKVLLIDRATFPSWPAVPSSPLIYPSAMRLLEELGFAEEDYAYPEAKVTHFILDMMGKFQAIFPTELMQLDRNYIYGIDRHKLDTALWQRAASLPLVTARDNFAMTDVVKDGDGRVTGIVGRIGERAEKRFQAKLVVGADGRFSLAAKKFGSRPFAELNDFPSASFHAEWEDVADYSDT
ncbi:MAG TPA: NAD(P)/FAD-dependent oxidoreductase, partial [Chloroflexota bacterium]|nr:NAD(P)/FAD-dependent oxidoreductase [Chloroflexota bacterium]